MEYFDTLRDVRCRTSGSTTQKIVHQLQAIVCPRIALDTTLKHNYHISYKEGQCPSNTVLISSENNASTIEALVIRGGLPPTRIFNPCGQRASFSAETHLLVTPESSAVGKTLAGTIQGTTVSRSRHRRPSTRHN